MILLPDTRMSEGTLVAERIRDAVSEKPFHVSGRQIFVSVSLGMVNTSTGKATIEDLLNQNHLVLYKSKDAEKNEVTYQWKNSPSAPKNENSLAHIIESFRRGEGLVTMFDPILWISIGASPSPTRFLRVPCLSLLPCQKISFTSVPRREFNAYRYSGFEKWNCPCSQGKLFRGGSLQSPSLNTEGNRREGNSRNDSERVLNGKCCIELSEQRIIGDPSFARTCDDVEGGGIKSPSIDGFSPGVSRDAYLT